MFILLSESHLIQATEASVDLLAGLMSISRYAMFLPCEVLKKAVCQCWNSTAIAGERTMVSGCFKEWAVRVDLDSR